MTCAEGLGACEGTPWAPAHERPTRCPAYSEHERARTFLDGIRADLERALFEALKQPRCEVSAEWAPYLRVVGGPPLRVFSVEVQVDGL